LGAAQVQGKDPLAPRWFAKRRTIRHNPLIKNQKAWATAPGHEGAGYSRVAGSRQRASTFSQTFC